MGKMKVVLDEYGLQWKIYGDRVMNRLFFEKIRGKLSPTSMWGDEIKKLKVKEMIGNMLNEEGMFYIGDLEKFVEKTGFESLKRFPKEITDSIYFLEVKHVGFSDLHRDWFVRDGSKEKPSPEELKYLDQVMPGYQLKKAFSPKETFSKIYNLEIEYFERETKRSEKREEENVFFDKLTVAATEDFQMYVMKISNFA